MRRQQSAPLVAVLLLAAAAVSADPQQLRPVDPEPVAQGQAQAAASKPPSAPEQAPTAETLGVPFYPSMEFLGSFDAGSGQRYYLFGVNAAFNDVVSWYSTALKQRGDLVFDEPATHEFDIGKFREETMAFPPSVTVKDYTWGGMAGYPNPNPKGAPAVFRTVIQIVPIPSTAPVVRAPRPD
jgi:hypothetical protein